MLKNTNQNKITKDNYYKWTKLNLLFTRVSSCKTNELLLQGLPLTSLPILRGSVRAPSWLYRSYLQPSPNRLQEEGEGGIERERKGRRGEMRKGEEEKAGGEGDRRRVKGKRRKCVR